MKKYILSFMVAMISFFAFMPESSAQIKYVDGGLLIGNVATPYYHYGITANTNGACFIGANNRFLQFDVTPSAAPRISGHGNQIVFYNTVTSTFNAIQVSQTYTHSDARSKSNIQNFKSGIDVIKQLRPVSYNFTNQQQRSVAYNQYTGYNAEIGLLAQELEEVIPNIVFTDDEGRKLVNYVALIPILIDAVQTLQQEVEELKSKL